MRGITTPRGGQWHASSLRNVLERLMRRHATRYANLGRRGSKTSANVLGCVDALITECQTALEVHEAPSLEKSDLVGGVRRHTQL